MSQRHDVAAAAEDLVRLPRGDLRRLAALHVGLSEEAEAMLLAAERVLRDLPSAVERSEVELRGAIRPPLAWRRTLERRIVTRDRSLFVCAPPQRRYDTPLARVLKLALAQAQRASVLARLEATGESGNILAERAAWAFRMGAHVKLRDVLLVDDVPAHSLQGALRLPSARPVVDFVRLYRDAVDAQTAAAIEQVVNRRLLAPSDSDRLLELFVGFEIVDELLGRGFHHVSQRLLPNRVHPFARMARGDETVDLWYQRPLSVVDSAARKSAYAETLAAAGLTRSSLRPDFILHFRSADRVLLIEVKFTARENESPERVGIKDVFTYLHDWRAQLDGRRSPRGLVVGWNSDASLHPSDVMVASQRQVRGAVAVTLAEWLDH